ncbi:MAG: tryptophan--tRNA ligase [Holosporaceae bacterium]|jgi:tryptophanyl-tRNA synthetase|nr:tryptophan--tRNA ligase [Holosporaceae bacterium]
MEKQVILTGDRPTGNLHLGHWVGSLQSRVALQHSFEQYVMVADTQALTDNFGNPQKVMENVMEVVGDYIAVGIDPQLTTIFIQSQIPALTELTAYYMNLVSLSRLERNPTVKAEIAQKEFEESVPAGFLCYPVSQAADITAFKAELVPVGADQLPMIELSNEIVRRFNRLYNTDCLKESKVYLSNTSRLIGIDGKAKASKSLNNAIFLSDTPGTIREKVFSMFTDPMHVHVSDPGRIEGNVVFTYLDVFHDDMEETALLKERYARGGLGDVTLKSLLDDVLQRKLQPIREKRESLSKKYLLEICFEGTQRAKSVAQKTLQEVKDAMGIDFFSDNIK